MKQRIKQLWLQNRSLFLFMALMCVFRSAIADWNTVPTGSMKPTIVDGDRILVNKMAYDLRLPFTHVSLYRLADPQRGDIIVFDSKATDMKLVKRVVGVPGDRIAMRHNEVFINGKALDYSLLKDNGDREDWQERLANHPHLIRVHIPGSRLSSFPLLTIPEGYYLALGDNRDNSADSRVIGLVPRQEIVGRTSRVAFSLNYDDYYLPRSERFFHALL